LVLGARGQKGTGTVPRGGRHRVGMDSEGLLQSPALEWIRDWRPQRDFDYAIRRAWVRLDLRAISRGRGGANLAHFWRSSHQNRCAAMNLRLAMGGAICLEVTAVTSASAPATDLLAVVVATHDERQPTPILPLCVTGRTTPTAVVNVVQFVKTGSEPSNSSIMFNMICLTCAPDFPSRALAEHQLVDAPLITMPDDEVLW